MRIAKGAVSWFGENVLLQERKDKRFLRAWERDGYLHLVRKGFFRGRVFVEGGYERCGEGVVMTRME